MSNDLSGIPIRPQQPDATVAPPVIRGGKFHGAASDRDKVGLKEITNAQTPATTTALPKSSTLPASSPRIRSTSTKVNNAKNDVEVLKRASNVVPRTSTEVSTLSSLKDRYVDLKQQLSQFKSSDKFSSRQEAIQYNQLRSQCQRAKLEYTTKLISVAERQLSVIGRNTPLGSELSQTISNLNRQAEGCKKDIRVANAVVFALTKVPQNKQTRKLIIKLKPDSSPAAQAAPTRQRSASSPAAMQKAAAAAPETPQDPKAAARLRTPPPPPTATRPRADSAPTVSSASLPVESEVPTSTVQQGPPPRDTSAARAATVFARTPPPVPPRPRSFSSTNQSEAAANPQATQRARSASDPVATGPQPLKPQRPPPPPPTAAPAPEPLPEPPPSLSTPPLQTTPPPPPNFAPPPMELNSSTPTSTTAPASEGTPIEQGSHVDLTRKRLMELHSSEVSYNQSLHEAADLVGMLNNPTLTRAYNTIMGFSDQVNEKLGGLAKRMEEAKTTSEFESAAKDYSEALNSLKFDEQVQQAFCDYAAGYEEALGALQKDITLKESISKTITERQAGNPSFLSTGLSGAMIQPVQRFMRYNLLADDIGKSAGKAENEGLAEAAATFAETAKALSARVNAFTATKETLASLARASTGDEKLAFERGKLSTVPAKTKTQTEDDDKAFKEAATKLTQAYKATKERLRELGTSDTNTVVREKLEQELSEIQSGLKQLLTLKDANKRMMFMEESLRVEIHSIANPVSYSATPEQLQTMKEISESLSDVNKTMNRHNVVSSWFSWLKRSR